MSCAVDRSLRASAARRTSRLRPRTPPFGGFAPSRMIGGIATFAPGARTVWHTHPIGQALIVTSGGRGPGVGWFGRRGEGGGPVVWFAPGEKHWHGATPSSGISHIAIVEADGTEATTWLEPVTDEQDPSLSRVDMQTKRNDGRDEPILDPELPIVDAHHHLFDLPNNRYMLDEFLADAQGGHNIVASVFCETQSFSLKGGPEWMRPLNEVEVANGIGALAQTGLYGKTRVCAGIVGHANLTFGAKIGELLDRGMAAAPRRFRGVRHVTVDYPDDRPFRFIMTYRPPAGLLDHPKFPEGLAELSRRGLTFDAAVYDPSLPKLTGLIDRFPDLQFVLDHQGVMVGLDMDAQEKGEVFARWQGNLRALAQRPNVVCKVGGLGMPVWGFGFEERPDPIGYEELATAWRPYVESAIEAFGADRCMMESNFPPDGRSCGYIPLWNALKHIVRGASAAEKTALFSGTVTVNLLNSNVKRRLTVQDDKPLAGLRVLEAGAYISGPYAGALLASLGADVVKVEPPKGGDAFRRGVEVGSPYFVQDNAGKRSLAVDLKKPDGVALIQSLLPHFDVFIENARPGKMDALGLSPDACRAINPCLYTPQRPALVTAAPIATAPPTTLSARATGGCIRS